MCKYLLDLIGFNSDEPVVDYEDSKMKLSITNIFFQNLTQKGPISSKYFFKKIQNFLQQIHESQRRISHSVNQNSILGFILKGKRAMRNRKSTLAIF